MALPQPTSVTRRDLSRGIDSLSPKGSIPEGFAEDLENVDTSVSGPLTTRAGYEGYYGWVPLRVSRATMLDSSTLKLEFGSSVDISLALAHQSPLVVAGRVSAAATGSFGTFETTSSESVWYSHFSLSNKVTYTAPSGTITQTATAHGQTSADFWVGAAESTSAIDTSNVAIIPDDLQIDTTSFQVDLDYTVATSANGYLYYRDQTATAGTKYNAAVSVSATTATVASIDTGVDLVETSAPHGLVEFDPIVFASSGTLPGGLSASIVYYAQVVSTTVFKVLPAPNSTYVSAVDITSAGSGTITVRKCGVQITAGTHNLNTLYLTWQLYDTSTVAGKQVAVIPDDVIIDDVAGRVIVIPVDPVAVTSFTGQIYLEAVPAAQTKITSATVSGGGPTLNTFTITTPGSPYLFFNAYRYNATYHTYESVIPDSWSYDASTDAVTVDYYLTGATGEPVEIYYTTGSIVANAITVTHSGTAGTDNTPELTVWGLDHAGIYRDADSRGGHVTHLDSYKRSGERRLISGTGGNLYRALAYSEAGDWSLGSAYTNLVGRCSADYLLAPLFHTTNPGSVRTRGVVYDATVVDNRAVVTTATYVSADTMRYTLSCTALTGTVSTSIATGSTGDYLTVTGMANPNNEGEFQITSVVSESATEVVLEVTNTAARAGLAETGARGRAGVFSDLFTTVATVQWLPDDIVLGASFTAAELTPIVYHNLNRTVRVTGITGNVQLSHGERLGVRRTTDVVPLRDSSGTETISGFVRGDMLVVGGEGALDRRPRVTACFGSDSATASVLSGTGTVATLSTSPTLHYLNAGDKVVLSNSATNELCAVYTVLSVPSTTTFTIASDSTTGTWRLQGHTVQLDEPITIEDGPDGATTFEVEGRWIPLEAPYTTYDLPADTYYRYLDVNTLDDQAALRSTIIQDSMYLTNGDDEVLKFDGTYLCRAGLPRWQPGLFSTNDTSATARLGTGASVAYASKSTTGLYFVAATAPFADGDWIYESTANKVWQVVKTVVVPGSPDTYQITVRPSDDISGAGSSGTLQKVLNYKYYYKLNLIDRNRAIVASFAAQSEDFVVQYAQAGQIRLRLVAPPAFGPLDYDRVELETYRTDGDGALYYLQSRQPVNFDRTAPYITVHDATSDTVLTSQGSANRDAVMSRLLGNELGTGWEPPPRASTITSLNNRLLLGNIKGYPETTLTIRPATGHTGVSAADLTSTIITLRTDSTDTDTTTDMTDVVRYQFVNSGQVTINPAADLARTSTTFTVTSAAHGLAVGDWVYCFHNHVPGPGLQLHFCGWWQIAAKDTNTFTINFDNSDSITSSFTFVDADVSTGADTITEANHGLVNGTRVKLSTTGTLPAGLSSATNYYVVGVTTNTFQLATSFGGGAVNITGAAGGGTHTVTYSFEFDSYATAATPTDVPVWIGVDGNYSMRDGNAAAQTDITIQAPIRLANAINSSMRATTTDLGDAAWLTAFAGQDQGLGTVKLVSPTVLATTPGLTASTPASSIKFYVDGVDFANDSYSKAFITRVFPSRLVRSYPNYPDLFDNCFAADQIDSDSIIDVNPADGQEITAVIPFFGEGAGASSNAALAAMAVVVKEQSLYVVNIETREVTRVDSRGMGGTAPRAVCVTQRGVVFVNESGVYRLNRDLSVSPIGLNMAGKVRDALNKGQLAEAHAHHWAQGRRVKISVPVDDELYPTEVWVYDYEREGKGQEFGAWTRYTDMPAVGWANLDADAYWASTEGDVFLVRQRGDETDFRDEDGSVAEAVVTLRAEDFGVPGVRKVHQSVITDVELPQTDLSGLTVQTAMNLSRTFETQGSSVTVDVADAQQRTFRTSLSQRRGNRLSVRYRHQTKDQALNLTGVTYTVAPLSAKLLPEQADQT